MQLPLPLQNFANDMTWEQTMALKHINGELWLQWLMAAGPSCQLLCVSILLWCTWQYKPAFGGPDCPSMEQIVQLSFLLPPGGLYSGFCLSNGYFELLHMKSRYLGCTHISLTAAAFMQLPGKAAMGEMALDAWRSAPKLKADEWAMLKVRPIFDSDRVVRLLSVYPFATAACIPCLFLPSVHRHPCDDIPYLQSMIAVLLCNCHASSNPQPGHSC